MRGLLGLARLIDAINERIGRASVWLVLITVLISATNAVTRKFSLSSNAALEIQWYLFSATFLLGASWTLMRNEHVRIDVLAGRLSPRAQNWIDVFGILAFLLPMSLLILWLSWLAFTLTWQSGEGTGNPGGLTLWPVRVLVPVGFFLLTLQGVSELIKRLAFLGGLIPNPLEKHKGPSAEDELAEHIKATVEQKP